MENKFDDAILVSEQKYIMHNSKVVSMQYIDLEKDIIIESSAIGNKKKNEILFFANKFENLLTNEHGMMKSTKQLPLNKIIDCRKVAAYYDYNNEQIKTENTFKFHLNNKYTTDLDFEIDKDYHVIYNGSICEIYNNDNKIVENYYIFENGILNHNFEENTIHFSDFKGNSIDFLYLYKNDKFNSKSDCLLFEYLPSLISISNNKEIKLFKLKYDDRGLINSFVSDNKELCKYDEQVKDSNKIIRSYNPHIIDNFNYNTSLDNYLWEFNEYIINNEKSLFTRRIYKLNWEQNERLIKYIQDNKILK